MMHDIVQALLLATSAFAIWFVTSRSLKWQIAGCAVGVLSAPFWLATSWMNGQWGVFVLSIVVTCSYAKGLRQRLRKGKQHVE